MDHPLVPFHPHPDQDAHAHPPALHTPYPNHLWIPAHYAPTPSPHPHVYYPSPGTYSDASPYAYHPSTVYPNSPTSPATYTPYFWPLPPADIHSPYLTPAQDQDHPGHGHPARQSSSLPPPPVIVQPAHHAQQRPRVRTASTGTPPRTGTGVPLTPPLTPATSSTSALTASASFDSAPDPHTPPPPHAPAHVVVSTPGSSGERSRPPRMRFGHVHGEAHTGPSGENPFAAYSYAYGYSAGYWSGWGDLNPGANPTGAPASGPGGEKRDRKRRQPRGPGHAEPFARSHQAPALISAPAFPLPAAPLPHVSEAEITRVLAGVSEGPSGGHFLLITGVPRSIAHDALKDTLKTVGEFRGIFVRYLPTHGFVVLPFLDARHAEAARRSVLTTPPAFPLVEAEGDAAEEGVDGKREELTVRMLTDEEVNALIGANTQLVLEANARLLIHLDASASPNPESVPLPSPRREGFPTEAATEGEPGGAPFDLTNVLASFGDVRAVEGVPGQPSTYIAEYFDARNAHLTLAALQNRTVRGVRLRISLFPSSSHAPFQDKEKDIESTEDLTPTASTQPTLRIRRLSTGSVGRAPAAAASTGSSASVSGAASPTLTHSASEQDLRKKAQAQAQVQFQAEGHGQTQARVERTGAFLHGLGRREDGQAQEGGAFFGATVGYGVRSPATLPSNNTTPRGGGQSASYPWMPISSVFGDASAQAHGQEHHAYFIENGPAAPAVPQYNLQAVAPSTRRTSLGSLAGGGGGGWDGAGRGLNVHAPPHVPFRAHQAPSPTASSALSGPNSLAPGAPPNAFPHPHPHAPHQHQHQHQPPYGAQNQPPRPAPYRGLRTGVHSGLGPRVVSEHNMLDLAAIESGQDMRTTVMVKNIPNKMNARELQDYIAGVAPRRIDFLYLRMDFQNGCNVGYAFVNFINVEDLLAFARARLGVKWNMFSSEKMLQMSYANYQGKEALVEKFKNSCIMDEREAWRPRIFWSDGPDIGLPEPFPAPTHLRRKERSLQNRGQLFVPAPHGGVARGGGGGGGRNAGQDGEA